MTIRIWGAGGGGEHIENNGVVRPGFNGGDSSFLGFTGEGGGGGGRNADNSTTKNAAGLGGQAIDGANWEFYGASVALLTVQMVKFLMVVPPLQQQQLFMKELRSKDM